MRSTPAQAAQALIWAVALAAGCDDGAGTAADGAFDATAVDAARADTAPGDSAPGDATVDGSNPDGGPADLAVDGAPSADMGLPFSPRPRNPPAATLDAPRGLTVARGLIHMHNVFSHDACDGMPLAEDGTPNAPCRQRFRDAMCHNRHDFVLMTDHPDSVAERTLIEALYHRPGDTLEDLDGEPVANHIDCGDGHTVWLAAGSEGDLMPVMFRRMPPPGLLRDASPEGSAGLKAEAGALVFQAHMERFDGPTASVWDLDGMEIYNIHANLDPNGPVLGQIRPDLIKLIGAGFDGPHPDLWFTGLFRPGIPALSTWDWTIARRRMLGFAGSDTHENVPLPITTGDGERIESYRRIGGWFSNRLLLDGPLSYASVRSALEAGRLYVVMDAFGLVDGFDVHGVDAAGAVVEMGGEMLAAPGASLSITAPRAPVEDTVELRVLRVTEDGPEEIARTTDPTLELQPPGPGAYRVEIWLTAEHLRPEMGVLGDDFIRPQVWVYSNPIYVRAEPPPGP